MASVGIRELKSQATEIVREVREQRAEYIITYRGKPVALILPLNESWQQATSTRLMAAQPSKDLWAELDELRQKTAKAWKTNLTAAEAVAEQRR